MKRLLRASRAVLVLLIAILLHRAVIIRAEPPSEDTERTRVALEALSRLKGIDLESNAAVKAAVLRVLEQVRGQPEFVELVRSFKLKGQEPALLQAAIDRAEGSAGVEAARLLLDTGQLDLLRGALEGTNAVAATALTEALGNTADKRAVPLLAPLLTDAKRDLALRKQAVRALAQTQDGAATMLAFAKQDKLPADLKLAARAELNAVRWPALRAEAARLLPLPQSQNAEPLPPVSELAKRAGDPTRGAEVFSRETVACNRCHQINGQGIDFGPNLSEIGAKLAKDALYAALLDPSAGISFGFEAWEIELKNGDEAFGLLVSETPDELAIKTQTGIVTRYKKDAIAKREQQKISPMPTGLAQTMSEQELVDLVEYLASLRKAGQ
ncbi:MAG: c-type cytochrome [Verrucomicrobia bacterium]|nr:c-type cytochrome [Verrucomicrobiota bacterium]